MWVLLPIIKRKKLLRCVGRYWHLTDKPTAPDFVAYWGNNGQRVAQGLNRYAAIDPSATLAVHCGNVFDVGFSTYQSARLIRYNGVSLAWGP